MGASHPTVSCGTLAGCSSASEKVRGAGLGGLGSSCFQGPEGDAVGNNAPALSISSPHSPVW